MQKEFFKGLESVNKSALESVRRLTQLQGKMLERFNARQMEMLTDYLNVGVQQIEMLSEIKDVQQAVAAQSKLAATAGETFVAHAKKNAEMLDAAKADLSAWFEEGMKQVVDNPLLKQAAATPKKAA